MPFKQDYLVSNGISRGAYADRNYGIARIRGFYRTARQASMACEPANELWTLFFELFRQRFPQLPQARAEYDHFVLEKITELGRLLRRLDVLQRDKLGEFGIAQKMVNLFMKEHWALNVFSAKTERLLHLPLDRRVLSKLKRCPGTWSRWTRVTDTPEHKADCQRIQDEFRLEWKRVAVFRSPIEMEQFIWYRIPHRQSE